MTAPALFQYNDHTVRTVEIEDEPWFVAADVCAVLGYARVGDALRVVDDDDLGTHIVRATDGSTRPAQIVNEPGLYVLILGSRKPGAKAFKRWVTHEVLPAIRRNGSYAVAERPTSTLDILAAQIAEMQRIEREAVAAVAAVREVEHRVDALEGNHGWYSALGYAKRMRWQADVATLNALGRRAGIIGRGAGLRAAKVPHPTFGEVNAWPSWVWDQAYQDTP